MTDELIMGSDYGRRLAAFIDQFGAWPADEPVPQLLITLHPALHDEHLRDVVHDLAFVNGVTDVHLVRAQGPALPLRAMLAGYGVRLKVWSELTAGTPAGDLHAPDHQPETPFIVLHHPASSTVLITAHPSAIAERIDQSSLDLGELVWQAVRHHAEHEDPDDAMSLDGDGELGLHCWPCKLTLHPVEWTDSPLCPSCGHSREFVHVATAEAVPPIA